MQILLGFSIGLALSLVVVGLAMAIVHRRGTGFSVALNVYPFSTGWWKGTIVREHTVHLGRVGLSIFPRELSAEFESIWTDAEDGVEDRLMEAYADGYDTRRWEEVAQAETQPRVMWGRDDVDFED